MALWFQKSRNVGSFISASQSQTAAGYSEYDASHCRDATATVDQPSVGYAQTDVEQWVRQQNASRQKQQELMAASSVYPGQVYRSCNQTPECGHYHCWSGGHQKPVYSGNMSLSSSVDLMRCSGGYGNMDAVANLHHFHHHENCRIPDDNLTMEQRQQRLSKMGRLQVIRQMIGTHSQLVPDECMEQVAASGSYPQSRGPWSSVPCASDTYTGHNGGSSQMRHQATSWDMMTTEQRRCYYMQCERFVNRMGMQNSFCHCQPTNSNVRYFEPHAGVNLPAEPCQMLGRERALPAYGVCDYTAVYPLCEPHVCTCGACVTKQYRTPVSGMYGYTDVGMQSKYSCQQQMSRCDEFVNEKYFANSRQLAYDTPYKGLAVGGQKWNSGNGDVMRQQHVMPASIPQQFDVSSQQVVLTHQPNNVYCADRNIVTETVSAAVSCVQLSPMLSVASARPRQSSSNRKRKNNSGTAAAQPAGDPKSKKLDSDVGEWPSCVVPATRSATLLNITSASLAHLAKGVENISAVMQQTIQQGGPFRYIQRPSDDADASDENANFIPAGSSLPAQAHTLPNPAEEKTSDRALVTLPLTSFQTSGSYSGTVSAPCHMYSTASTTGVNVVIMSKAPYTISYRPTSISSEANSEDVPSNAFSQSARMVQQQAYVERNMSSVGTASSSHRHIPSNEGLSHQEKSGILASHKNLPDAAKVNQGIAAAAAAGSNLSMASSVAVIQPQMMSGTQLFIADRSSEPTAPVMNNFDLPASMPQSGAFVSSQQSHFMQRGTSYQTFGMRHASVMGGGSDVTTLCPPLQSVQANNTEQLRSLVCTPSSAKSWSSVVAGGMPVMSRYAQSSVRSWHQPNFPAGNASFSHTQDDKYTAQTALPASGVGTTPT